MKIENEIISSVIAAVKELYGQDVPEKMVALQKTKSNFEGNLTLVVFPFLKMSKKKPEDTAQEIGVKMRKTIIKQLFQDTFAAKVHILRFFFTFW